MPELSIKERFSALNNLPRFFKLVWQTSPALSISNAILRIVRSAIPIAILYVGKLIIDQVILSLPTYNMATGIAERTIRNMALEIESTGLVCHTSLKNLGRLLSAE